MVGSIYWNIIFDRSCTYRWQKSNLHAVVVDVFGFSQYHYARNVGSWLFISDVKSNYNIVAAVIVSTGLFTFAHGGAFEAGILPMLNVITMSLFVTAVLEYTDSLIAPIMIHFLWNGIGAIVLGGVSLAEDYPHLFNMVISGNPILSGGRCKIEGSIIVLLMNLILMIGFVMVKRKRNRNL